MTTTAPSGRTARWTADSTSTGCGMSCKSLEDECGVEGGRLVERTGIRIGEN
jgi:hypothetical protein